MFSLICVWINGWVKNGEAGDLRRHRAHYDVILMEVRSMRCFEATSHKWKHVVCILLELSRTDRMIVPNVSYKNIYVTRSYHDWL